MIMPQVLATSTHQPPPGLNTLSLTMYRHWQVTIMVPQAHLKVLLAVPWEANHSTRATTSVSAGQPGTGGEAAVGTRSAAASEEGGSIAQPAGHNIAHRTAQRT